jgi:hypothetical protein
MTSKIIKTQIIYFHQQKTQIRMCVVFSCDLKKHHTDHLADNAVLTCFKFLQCFHHKPHNRYIDAAFLFLTLSKTVFQLLIRGY